MTILKVGLTGGLASGKSLVARRLMERGFPVLDADLVVRDLYRPGRAGAAAISRSFGRDFLDSTGAVDRRKLGQAAFSQPDRVRELNALIHPLVIEEQRAFFERLERSGAPVGVVEATLLVESGGRDRFDVLIAVSAPEEKRLARAAARSPEIPIDQLRSRIAAQLRDAERERVADFVIRNEGSEEMLRRHADSVADALAERLGTR